MRATAYYIERVRINRANVLTELANATQEALNEVEINRNGQVPHWEIVSTIYIGDGEIMNVWARWEI